MFVFFHRMPKHHAGSRRGWYARQRRSLTARMESMEIQERNAECSLPTNQQLHEFVERARHIATDTINPHISLFYLVLALACIVIKVECCVYIPDLSSNVSDAVNDLQHQILPMQDSSLSFWEQVKSWFMSDWWKNLFIVLVVVLCFLCCGPCILQCIMNLVTERIIKFSRILKN